VMVGTGRGAEAGVLIRNAEALETLQRADTLVVDKTGTLTEGKPKLAAVETVGAWEQDELLRLAAGLERGSEHPLAAAIIKGAETRNLVVPPATEFQSVTGRGVVGKVEGRRILLGNAALLAEHQVSTEPLESRMDALRREAQTVMFVAVDGQLAGLLSVVDPIRASTADAIQEIHADGMRIIMLTGDSRATAAAVSRKLGIEVVVAEVWPGEKWVVVKGWQKEGGVVGRAGDAINAPPALAQAIVGIAMGRGTDVEMESAAIPLVQGHLRGIARARRLSRATM